MRLIDADALIEKTECLFKDLNSTEDYMGIGYNHGVGDSITIIKFAPTIEADPVRHGRWLWIEGVRCSICNYKLQTTGLPMYCPNCGSQMDEGSEEE